MSIVGVECNADRYFFGRLLNNKNLIRKEKGRGEEIEKRREEKKKGRESKKMEEARREEGRCDKILREERKVGKMR